MRDSVPSGSYSSVCNVLCQWKSCSSLLIESTDSMIYIYIIYLLCIVSPYICMLLYIYTITLDKVSLSRICTRQELVAWE